jgi:hypothetical protein
MGKRNHVSDPTRCQFGAMIGGLMGILGGEFVLACDTSSFVNSKCRRSLSAQGLVITHQSLCANMYRR